LGRARSLSVLGADGGSIARSPAPSLPATTALESLAPWLRSPSRSRLPDRSAWVAALPTTSSRLAKSSWPPPRSPSRALAAGDAVVASEGDAPRSAVPARAVVDRAECGAHQVVDRVDTTVSPRRATGIPVPARSPEPRGRRRSGATWRHMRYGRRPSPIIGTSQP